MRNGINVWMAIILEILIIEQRQRCFGFLVEFDGFESDGLELLFVFEEDGEGGGEPIM